MIRGVKINSPQQKGIFKYLAQNVSCTLQGSGVKTSVASILKTLESSDLNNNSPKDHSSEFSEYGIATSLNYGHLKIGDGLTTDQEKVMNKLPLIIRYRSRVAVNRNNELFFVGEYQEQYYTSYKYMILNSDNDVVEPQSCNMYLGSSNSKFIGLGDKFIGFSTNTSSYFFYYQKNSLTGEWEFKQRWISFPYSTGGNFLLAQNTVDGNENWENNHDDAILIMLKDNNNYYRFYWLNYNFSLTPAFDYSINSNILSISLNLDYATLAIVPGYIFVIDMSNLCIWKHSLTTNDTWTSFDISVPGGVYGHFYSPSPFVNLIDENNYGLHICCINNSYSVRHFIYNSTSGGSWNCYIENFSPRSKGLSSGYTFFYLNNKIYNLPIMQENFKSVIYSRLINLNGNTQWESDGFNYISHDLEIDPTKIYLKEESSIDDPLENAREPIPHASPLEKYGLGTTDLYGHVKLIDDYENIPLNSKSITELSLRILNRDQSAINMAGQCLFIGFNNGNNLSYQYLTPKGLSKPQIFSNEILNFLCGSDYNIEDLLQVSVAGLGNGFLLFGSNTNILRCWIDNDTNTLMFESVEISLPYDFYSSDRRGLIAYLPSQYRQIAWNEELEDDVFIMLYDWDAEGWKLYRITLYTKSSSYLSIEPIFDYTDPDNILFTYSNGYALTLVLTPLYIVVLDTNDKIMWKCNDSGWRSASRSLPFIKTLGFPMACVNNFDDENCFLHIFGNGNYDGRFFQKTFDLNDMRWSPPNQSAGQFYLNPAQYQYLIYSSGCSFFEYNQTLYLFVGNDYTSQDTYTSKIYSCNINVFEPTWQEGSILVANNSQAAGGNGLVASSYAINTLKNNFNSQINQIMSERNFHNELDRRLTEYLVLPEHND